MLSTELSTCMVFDKNSEQLSFHDVLEHQTNHARKVLVIFIRHFFCGNCQEYVRRLSTDLSPSVLPENLSVVIVGCGAPSLIQSYIEVTDCKFPIFADPSTHLYKQLGMHRSLSLGPKGPAYIRQSLASGMVKSIVQGIKRIPNGDVMQAGHLDVNGGEFVFDRIDKSEKGAAGWQISWSHCMKNSRDHTEIAQLKTVLELPSTNSQRSASGPPPITHSQARTVDSSHVQRKPSFRKRHSWMGITSSHTRSSSVQRSMVPVT